MTPTEKLTKLAALIEKHRVEVVKRAATGKGATTLIAEARQITGDDYMPVQDAIYTVAKHHALIEFKTL